MADTDTATDTRAATATDTTTRAGSATTDTRDTATTTADTDTDSRHSDTATSDTPVGDATRDTATRHRDTVTVIENTDVHRDWRHHATTAAAVAFAADSAAAVYLAALDIHPQVVWTLTALSPALALTLAVLTHHTRQAGRRLTWANPR